MPIVIVCSLGSMSGDFNHEVTHDNRDPNMNSRQERKDRQGWLNCGVQDFKSGKRCDKSQADSKGILGYSEVQEPQA